jgi:hypothetical protein
VKEKILEESDMTSKKLYTIGGIFFLSIGLLIGFITCGLIVWGDLEATLFTNGMNGEKRIGTLNCPVLITPNEIGKISVVVKNPAERDSDRFLRASISEGYTTLIRESKEIVPIPAGGKQKVEWKIYPEDAAYERIILFRLYIPSKYPYPSMSGSCGVIMLNLPWLSGNQVLIGMALFGMVSLCLGAFFMERKYRTDTNIISTRAHTRLMGIYALAVILFVSSILSYFGMWVLGVIGLAAAMILICSIIFRR